MKPVLDVDPYAPLAFEKRGRFDGQRQARRALILAATRRAMSEDGYRHFNIASVAETCGVSIQTIYYNFGNKKELLLSALHEYNRYVHFVSISENSSPTVFLDIVEKFCQCAEYMKDFMREWILCSYDQSQPLLLDLQKRGQKFKVDIIGNLSPDYPIRSGVKSHRIAYLLSKSNTSSLFDWVHHQDDDELKHQIITSTAEVINSSFSDDVASCVDGWMAARLKAGDRLILH